MDRPPPSSPVPILAELAETARRLVEQRPEATVSLTVQTPAGALSAVVSWADGQASITVPTPVNEAAGSGAATSDGHPEHPPGTHPGGSHPAADGNSASGSAPGPPPHPIYGHPPGAGGPPPAGYPSAGGYPSADAQPAAAAQLAEILRQDPSLLTHRQLPDPQPPA